MSIYQRKLLELVSIEKISDNHFLHIRLSFEQDIEMLWKIGEYTAENLKTITEFGREYKYRLSFNSSWNTIQKQHISLLTRTYREQSERIYFPCSEEYINELTNLKHIQNINELDMLTFISTNLEPIEEKHNVQKQEQDEEMPKRKNNRKFVLAFITIVSILLPILLGYSSHGYQNIAPFNEKALAESIQIDDETDMIQKKKLDKIGNQMVAENTKNIKNVSNVITNQPTIPFVELNESITYNIPEGYVALTFDDGPSQYSMQIMDVLKKYGVGGTFFFIGLNVKKYPDHVEYIYSNGYSIGSHSMNHINVSKLSCETQENELIQSSKLIEEITNDKVIFFRPPYGSINKQTKTLINEKKYKMVMWNNDPQDWKSRDADKIFNDIQNSDVSGSIILLHESQAVLDALPRIIEYLQEQDLRIVNLQ